MRKYGFHNYKKFIDFKPMLFKGITFLVGKNNSGKSTAIKAMLLFQNYLRSNDYKTFSFDTQGIEKNKILTYGKSRNQFSEDFIKFSIEDSNMELKITVSGNPDKTMVEVHSIIIIDFTKSITYDIQPKNNSITIVRSSIKIESIESEDEILKAKLEREILDLKEQNKKYYPSSDEYTNNLDKIRANNKRLKIISKARKETTASNLYSLQISDLDSSAKSLPELFNEVFELAEKFYSGEVEETQENSHSFINLVNYPDLLKDSVNIKDSIKAFLQNVTFNYVLYLGHYSGQQSSLYMVKDSNNQLAQAIHEFYNRRILPGTKGYLFLQRWMKIFEFGEDIKIINHADEAYELKIIDQESEIHLADKGTGTIHLMQMLLTFSIIIDSRRGFGDQFMELIGLEKSNPLIIIEEPEINLHPSHQTKLTNLFYELHTKFNLDLFVETHSEYLIRKSQLIVKNKFLEANVNENPFCVIYFDELTGHKQIQYRGDGKFIDEFGTGFFDESSILTLDLY